MQSAGPRFRKLIKIILLDATLAADPIYSPSVTEWRASKPGGEEKSMNSSQCCGGRPRFKTESPRPVFRQALDKMLLDATVVKYPIYSLGIGAR